MGSPRVIADPATLIAIAWLIIAAFSSLVDAFYASKIIPKHLYITKGATRTKTSRKSFTKRLTQITLIIFATLLIISTTILVLNTSAAGRNHSPQVLIAPVQIRTSGRDQVYKDVVKFLLRDLNERPHVPVLTPPVPPPTISGLRRWPTPSNMATQLSSLMPMVIIYSTLMALVSGALATDRAHLLPVMAVVACAAVKRIPHTGLRAMLVLLRAESVYVVRMVLAIVWALFECLISPFTYCMELGLTFIKYFVHLSSGLTRNVNSLTHTRYSVIPVLTQLLRRNFLLQYTVAVTTLFLTRLLIGVLMRRYHAQLVNTLALLRCAAVTALMALVIKLDPSSESGILAQDPSSRQAREAIKKVVKSRKDQEDVPAVEGSPGARSPSNENVPVDFAVFPIFGSRLTIDQGPKDILESNRTPLQTLMNDQRPESTRLATVHPPSATVLADIEDLLRSPIPVLNKLHWKLKLTEPELVYTLMVVLEECNKRHQTVHDGLVKNIEIAETRIRSEARKNRALALELNALKRELKHTHDSMAGPKDINANSARTRDSMLYQVEGGKTASVPKLESAASSACAGETTKPPTEDGITCLQGLLSNLRGLRDLAQAVLVPEHRSGSDKCGEVDAFSSNSIPHPRVCDLIADCNVARIEISQVISLLAIQRIAETKHHHAGLKKQQAFREELTDRVTELRKEHETRVENLFEQLRREKAAHEQTKAFNTFYLRLHSKRENSLQEEVEKREGLVKQLREDVYCLQRKIKDTEALRQEILRPNDFKEWVQQWFAQKEISKITGIILEERYRSALKDLDKVITQMDVLATESNILNQHAELLLYICTKLFNLTPKQRRLVNATDTA